LSIIFKKVFQEF